MLFEHLFAVVGFPVQLPPLVPVVLEAVSSHSEAVVVQLVL